MKTILIFTLLFLGCAGAPNLGTAPEADQMADQKKSFEGQIDAQKALAKKKKLFVLQSRLTKVESMIAAQENKAGDDEVKLGEVDRLKLEKETIEEQIKEVEGQ